MPERDTTSRRTILKSLGVAAGVGTIGSGHAIAQSLDSGSARLDSTSAAVDDAVVSTDWPQVQGNAAKTGVASSGPRSNVDVAWESGADDRQRYGDPVVADDAVYATTEEGLVSLTTDGEYRWFADAAGDESYRYSAPAVDGDTVYVAAKAAETDCEEKTGSALVALDTADGTELGRTPLGGSDEAYQPPTVADGMLYVVGTENLDNSGTVYAVDPAASEVVWQMTLDGSGINSLNTGAIAVDGGVAYLASEQLHALDAATGDMLWAAETSDLRSMQDATPTVVGDTVYVGAGRDEDTVYAVDTDDGSIRWENQPPGPDYGVGYWTSGAVAGDTIVFGFTVVEDDRDPGYYAFDAEDGSLVWQTRETRSEVVAPAAAGDAVYVWQKALDAADGSVLWDRSGDDPQYSANPAVVDDAVYAGGGSLTAITGETEEANETANTDSTN